jgi:hypothetical protein
MLAPIYHARYSDLFANTARCAKFIRLSQITSGILKDLYSIRRINSALRASLTEKYSAELQKWRSGIAHFLDLRPMDTSLMIPLFQRQNTVLNLAFRHVLILLHRPLLLSNFESLTKPSVDVPNGLKVAADRSVAECLEAALGILGIVNDLCEGRQLYRAFWVWNCLRI